MGFRGGGGVVSARAGKVLSPNCDKVGSKGVDEVIRNESDSRKSSQKKRVL